MLSLSNLNSVSEQNYILFHFGFMLFDPYVFLHRLFSYFMWKLWRYIYIWHFPNLIMAEFNQYTLQYNLLYPLTSYILRLTAFSCNSSNNSKIILNVFYPPPLTTEIQWIYNMLCNLNCASEPCLNEVLLNKFCQAWLSYLVHYLSKRLHAVIFCIQ